MSKRNKLKDKEKELLRSMIFEVNNAIMDMINIHSAKDGYLYTDIDRAKVLVKGKPLRLHSITKEDIPFRPVYNSKIMLIVFGLYTNKLAEEGRKIESYEYGPGSSKKDKIYISCIESGYDPVISKPYYNDSLRFFDVMCQLEEISPPVDLELLDELMII